MVGVSLSLNLVILEVSSNLSDGMTLWISALLGKKWQNITQITARCKKLRNNYFEKLSLKTARNQRKFGVPIVLILLISLYAVLCQIHFHFVERWGFFPRWTKMVSSLQYVLPISHCTCTAGEQSNPILHSDTDSAHVYSVNLHFFFQLEQLSLLQSFVKS